MASVAPSRLAALARLRCSIFQTSFNPTSMRTGAKYLRKRLVGPSMLNYYPREVSIAKLNSWNPGWDLVDLKEQQRVQDVDAKKKRGKGTPKKAKTKGTSHAYLFVYRLLITGLEYSGKSSVAQKTVDWLRNAVVYLTLRFPSLRIDFQALLPKPLRLLSITP